MLSYLAPVFYGLHKLLKIVIILGDVFILEYEFVSKALQGGYC